jgi:hypothetical protein
MSRGRSLMTRPVLTKADFVARYREGEFGNASPTWDSVEEFLANPPMGDGQKYHLRNRVTGGPTWYNIDEDAVEFCYYMFLEKGVEAGDLYVSAMAPTELTLIQGEVQRGIWGLDLYYSQVRKPMRDALREQSRSVSGIISNWLLQHYLCPASYEWLQYLLDSYPNHVVEFSTYDTEWGTVPGYNTVWWEVRAY